MKDERIINLLSMAQRAGKVASGEFAVEKALAAKKIELLLVAGDAADSTKKTWAEAAERHGFKVYYVLSRETLGHCLGKEFRSTAALLDRGFSKALEQRIVNED